MTLNKMRTFTFSQEYFKRNNFEKKRDHVLRSQWFQFNERSASSILNHIDVLSFPGTLDTRLSSKFKFNYYSNQILSGQKRMTTDNLILLTTKIKQNKKK